MSQGVVFFDRKFLAYDQASVPITDLAVQRGSALFETLRTYNRKPFTLVERIKRLENSAEYLGFRYHLPRQRVLNVIKSGMRKVPKGELLIKLIVTGGDSAYLAPQGPARLYILFLPFEEFPTRMYDHGISVLAVKQNRVLPELKSSSYLTGVYAHKLALQKGFDEAVFANSNNQLTEGTTFNFGMIKGKKIVAAKQGVLEGLTMEIVLKLAKKIGLQVSRQPVGMNELKLADECFITSINREIIPVVRVGSQKISNGKPGGTVARLRAKYQTYARAKSISIS